HLVEVSRVPLRRLGPLDRAVVIGLGTDRGRIGRGHLPGGNQLLRGGGRGRPAGIAVEPPRRPGGVGGDRDHRPRQGTGDLARRRGAEVPQPDQHRHQLREVRGNVLGGRGRGLPRGRVLLGGALVLRLRSREQGGALHGEGGGERGQGRGHL